MLVHVLILLTDPVEFFLVFHLVTSLLAFLVFEDTLPCRHGARCDGVQLYVRLVVVHWLLLRHSCCSCCRGSTTSLVTFDGVRAGADRFLLVVVPQVVA